MPDIKRSEDDAAQWAKFARWKVVQSSNVFAIHYDMKDLVLSVQFRNGAVYKYNGVPHHIARQFYISGSKGKFVAYMLRDKYDTEGPL